MVAERTCMLAQRARSECARRTRAIEVHSATICKLSVKKVDDLVIQEIDQSSDQQIIKSNLRQDA
jgi:hypothetical protein